MKWVMIIVRNAVLAVVMILAIIIIMVNKLMKLLSMMKRSRVKNLIIDHSDNNVIDKLYVEEINNGLGISH